ncbi:L,D-transpeptidase family protein [Porphyrobacter sp. GA68]|uniref:L,D-transpeptidase family protein n=1 Tax=Porphyrobacter sp. GA68 TaxID=2883480 RepID=UPI001D18C890|nr:L,D-transpeptidase family protein [Porphyrobacter sp. GA68]
MRLSLLFASTLVLAGCNINFSDEPDGAAQQSSTAPAQTTDNLADSMASADYGARDGDVPDIADPEQRPMMQAQVTLDRLGFGPGVIDGQMGISTRNALEGFQEASGLQVTGQLDEPTRQALGQGQQFAATRIVRIPQDWAQEQYRPLPDDPADQAQLDRMGYTSLDERLAERFHTTVDVLRALNPGGTPAGMTLPQTGGTGGQTASPAPQGTRSSASEAGTVGAAVFRPGQLVRVPNIGADRIVPGAVQDESWQATLASLGVGSDQPEAARIVVSKSKNTLRAYDSNDRLIALFTVSSGSEQDPLPLGDWKILGKAYNPDYSYDPTLLRNAPDSDDKQRLPPGPNNPVGVVWIDLSKEHYGIHGTPEPQTIGRAQSNGCVRLTNWDAARLAQMVSTTTKVEFVA